MHKTGLSIEEHLAGVAPARRQRDALTLIDLMSAITGRPPKLWSGNIIGFGACRYTYPTGTEGEAPILAFAPRKTSSTVYLLDAAAHTAALAELGPHTSSKACLYLTDVEKVDAAVLRRILESDYARVLAGGDAQAEFTVLD